MVRRSASTSLLPAFLAFLIAVALSLSGLCTHVAYADEAKSKGLDLALSADKEKYGPDETATISLSIKNNSDETHYDVWHLFSIPDGLELVENSSKTGEHGDLDHDGISASSIKLKLASDKTASTSLGALPQTGDNAPITTVLLIAFLALIAAYASKKKLGKQAISFALIVSIATYGLSIPSLAFADNSSTSHIADNEISISIDGNEYIVGVAVSSTTKAGGEVADNNGADTVSRGQWIANLLNTLGVELGADIADCPFADIGNSPYADAVRTAWAHGFFDNLEGGIGSVFDPDAPVTRGFALATAVLSLGFTDDGANLAANDASVATDAPLIQIAIDLGLANLDEDGNIRPNEILTSQEKQDILGAVKQYLANNGPTESNVVYQDDVIVISDYAMDGTCFIVDATKYPMKEGSKVAFLPTEDNARGNAGCIASIVSKNDNLLTVSLNQAESPDEVFEEITIHDSTVAIDLSDIEWADGVEVLDEPSTFALSANQRNATVDTIKLKVPIVDDVYATVKLKPFVEVESNWKLGQGFENFHLSFQSDLKLDLKGSATGIEATTHLTKKPITLVTAYGFYVGIMADLNVKLDGSISITYEIQDTYDIKQKNNHWAVKYDTNSSLSASMDASLSAGIAPYLFVSWLSIELSDIQIDAGLSCEASKALRDTGMVCLAVTMSPYATLSIGKNTAWLRNLNLTLEKQLIRAKDVPSWMKGVWHFEDAERVPECTWGKDKDDPEDEPKPDDPPKQDPVEELALVQETMEQDFSLPDKESILWIPITTTTDCAGVEVAISDPDDGEFDAFISYGIFVERDETSDIIDEKGISLYGSYAIKKDNTTTLSVDNAGTYYLGIMNSCKLNSEYYDESETNVNSLHLVVNVLNNDSNENNNDESRATSISADETKVFRLVGREDVDYFVFTVDNPGKLTVNVRGANEKFDSAIAYSVYALSDGDDAAWSDDHGVSNGAAGAFSYATKDTYELPSAGTYYIKIANGYYWNPYYHADGGDNKNSLYISYMFNPA